LGVAILTGVGFFGVLLNSNIDKKYILTLVILPVVALPLLWNILADYQRSRIVTFLNPTSDPYGAGYNSIQSMISVGSGRFLGRGLGKGVQTQLAFLPERHTDFIFASVAEELGFVGSTFLLVGLFVLFWRLIRIYETTEDHTAKGFITGMFFTLFFQIMIHVGMNMGLFPITGVPLPLVSAGGSSLLGTMIGLGIIIGIKRSAKGV
jgi:rod shape determining protein RodA